MSTKTLVVMGLGMAKVGIKFGSSEFYPNLVPAGNCFVIVSNGMYYTFADQKKTIKYRQLLATEEINFR